MQAPPPRRTAQKVRRGRACARVVLSAVLLTTTAAGALGQATTKPVVTIGRDGAAYTVAARFAVPQSAATVFEVLSDYEGIPRFMPDIKKSIVHDRTDTRTVVEQEAVSRVGVFSKRVHLMLDVHRVDDTLRFRDTSGRSFDRYDGSWHVTQDAGQTVIEYRLAADPAFKVPPFLIRRLLERDAHETIGRLRGEMAARAPVR